MLAGDPEGVTVVGLKKQVTPLGSPEHAKLTAELKPFWGVTVRVTAPWPPESTMSEVGDAPSVKLAWLIVYTADVTKLFA